MEWRLISGKQGTVTNLSLISITLMNELEFNPPITVHGVHVS